MHLTRLLGILTVIVAVAVLARSVAPRSTRSGRGKPVNVILIGASIGQGWRLAEWPARVGEPDFHTEAVAVWQFDKGEALEEVLLRPGRKVHLTRTYLKSWFAPPPPVPDIVILKECSSYFPGDLAVYEQSTVGWVQRLLTRKIKVVLATVVPVSRSRDAGKQGKQESLLKYNRWVRTYAQQHGLPLLDLEAAMRENQEGSYLQGRFDYGDGTHLNATAYAVLDATLQKLLRDINPPDASGAHAAQLIAN